MLKISNLKFTLIEMLIVIVIIGILAVLTGAAAIRATSSANRSACINNLRQIGAGLNIYVQCNNYHLPICTMRPSAPPLGEENMPGIAHALLPSCGGTALIFLCPGDVNQTYFKAERSSYEWQSSLVNGKSINPKSLKLLGINRFVMMDYGNFHDDASGSAKNYLYADGRAIQIPEIH